MLIHSLTSQQSSEYKLGSTTARSSALPLGPCAADFTHEEMGKIVTYKLLL